MRIRNLEDFFRFQFHTSPGFASTDLNAVVEILNKLLPIHPRRRMLRRFNEALVCLLFWARGAGLLEEKGARKQSENMTKRVRIRCFLGMS